MRRHDVHDSGRANWSATREKKKREKDPPFDPWRCGLAPNTMTRTAAISFTTSRRGGDADQADLTRPARQTSFSQKRPRRHQPPWNPRSEQAQRPNGGQPYFNNKHQKFANRLTATTNVQQRAGLGADHQVTWYAYDKTSAPQPRHTEPHRPWVQTTTTTSRNPNQFPRPGPSSRAGCQMTAHAWAGRNFELADWENGR